MWSYSVALRLWCLKALRQRGNKTFSYFEVIDMLARWAGGESRSVVHLVVRDLASLPWPSKVKTQGTWSQHARPKILLTWLVWVLTCLLKSTNMVALTERTGDAIQYTNTDYGLELTQRTTQAYNCFCAVYWVPTLSAWIFSVDVFCFAIFNLFASFIKSFPRPCCSIQPCTEYSPR